MTTCLNCHLRRHDHPVVLPRLGGAFHCPVFIEFRDHRGLPTWPVRDEHGRLIGYLPNPMPPPGAPPHTRLLKARAWSFERELPTRSLEDDVLTLQHRDYLERWAIRAWRLDGRVVTPYQYEVTRFERITRCFVVRVVDIPDVVQLTTFIPARRRRSAARVAA